MFKATPMKGLAYLKSMGVLSRNVWKKENPLENEGAVLSAILSSIGLQLDGSVACDIFIRKL